MSAMIVVLGKSVVGPQLKLQVSSSKVLKCKSSLLIYSRV